MRQILIIQDQPGEYSGSLPVGDYYAYALARDLLGSVAFGNHSSSAESALFFFYVGGEVVSRADLFDEG